MERLDFLAQRYSFVPSNYLRLEEDGWTDYERFCFDEAVALAGVYAEKRAYKRAREEAEADEARRPQSGLPIVDRHGNPIKRSSENPQGGSRVAGGVQNDKPFELRGPDGQQVLLPRSIPMIPKGSRDKKKS